ncbi:MAG TPA: glycosyltransferase 61 family protein [Jatrophihabitantaceae bacterium]|nr:glycosyltransferase 61 family protein [Jatrophihabitantaceae bacterium]
MRLPAPLRPMWPYLKNGYVRATRAAAPVSMGLSRMRGNYLPTSIVETMEQAAASSGGRCETARPTEAANWPRAEGIPDRHPAFAAVEGEVIPRVAVAELPGGRVLGSHRAVITGTGSLVQEISRYFGTSHPRQHPLFLNPFPEPPLEVSGRLGVLATRGDQNYYHFLVDAICRLGIMEQCPEIEAPDQWYVPSGAPWQREILTMFGVPESAIIDSDRHPHVRAETLVVPGLPAVDVLNPRWAMDFLRTRMRPFASAHAEGGRIYLSRGASANNRMVENEAQVLDEVLLPRGFRVLNPAGLSVADQIAEFAAATAIVTPHGAGMTNVLFASPGCRVVELFPDATILQPCYWRLAHTVPGVEYRYLAGSRLTTRGGLGGMLVRDIVVDTNALGQLLD